MTASSCQKMWLWPGITKCTPGLGAAPEPAKQLALCWHARSDMHAFAIELRAG